MGVLCLAAALAVADGRAAEPPPTSVVSPLPFSVPHIQRGRQFYVRHCVTCHGTDGRGDTEMREFLKTAPADLTDDVWVYGGGDGALFHIIKAGSVERDMPGFLVLLLGMVEC